MVRGREQLCADNRLEREFNSKLARTRVGATGISPKAAHTIVNVTVYSVAYALRELCVVE